MSVQITYFQTTDLEVSPPGSNKQDDSKGSPDKEQGAATQPKLLLTLRGPNLPGVNDVEVELNDPEKSIFHAVQYIIQVVVKKTLNSFKLVF